MQKRPTERQAGIVELVRADGFRTIDQLAERFDVTPQTIRRDVNALCDEGLLRRRHGGVEENRQVMRVGIIGGGLMGREAASCFGRWFALTDVPVRAKLVAVCDLRDDLLEWFAQVPTVQLRTTDHSELLAREDVDKRMAHEFTGTKLALSWADRAGVIRSFIHGSMVSGFWGTGQALCVFSSCIIRLPDSMEAGALIGAPALRNTPAVHWLHV